MTNWRRLMPPLEPQTSFELSFTITQRHWYADDVKNLLSRRCLIRLAGAAALCRGSVLPAQAPKAAAGRVKITGFTIHKVTVRWRDLVFLEMHTDAGLTGLGEATLEGRSAQVEA